METVAGECSVIEPDESGDDKAYCTCCDRCEVSRASPPEMILPSGRTILGEIGSLLFGHQYVTKPGGGDVKYAEIDLPH